jgi:molecular chaperone DnaK (HSP70)
MGRKFDEVGSETAACLTRLSVQTTATRGWRRAPRKMSPPEISAMCWPKLKQAAEDYLGEKVTTP